ncbi:pentapeptide repeat-containing protein [Streptomyces sp. NPDC014344]|uniref:pentapeptide repeat-containing protein n=1 Tax=Streptomyces sp. NPDC014344 TaxID=3364871 RepID=UPI0037021E51
MTGHTACLAHLAATDRDAYLNGLTPGTDIDHRGTPFTEDLLNRLLTALHDPTTGEPHIGTAWFDGATFTGTAWFVGATFTGDAKFGRVTFAGDAKFAGATFTGDAGFGRAIFTGDAGFVGAAFTGDAGFLGATFTGTAGFYWVTFTGDAKFDWVTFAGDAGFAGATFAGDAGFAGAIFTGDAKFAGAIFTGDARFAGAIFTGDAGFAGARFETVSRLGPAVCGARVVLDGAVFGQPVTVEMAAREVSCARTRWISTATLHLRYAEVDLRDAILEYPVVVAARPDPFSFHRSGNPLSEAELSGREPGVRLTSVGGVDAAHLALHTIDLSMCRFAGAVHLDQLRVDGWCTFATTPTGRGRRFPWRWSRRNTLAEEHHWRVRTARRPARAHGWTAPSSDAPELRPAAVAALYRQIRKSLEDGKNEPDAADFYYGECEMRRHDTFRSRGERMLLTAYWALSGYGLRATRALAWLGAAMTATIAVMVLWGLPVDDPKPTTTGRQAAVGQQVTLTTDTPDPVNPTGPLPDRVTGERFEKALRVVINSVVFRSSGQDLTTTGTYAEMTSRLAEPVLLGLVVLAVRSRVKR